MTRLLSATTILAGAAGLAVPADASPLVEGRSVYRHHHHHAAHYYEMTHRHHRGYDHYVVGGHHHRSTATGGNPGGYADRN